MYIEVIFCVVVVFVGLGVVVDRYLFCIVYIFCFYLWFVYGEWISKILVFGWSGYYGNWFWNIIDDFFIF